MNKTRFLFAALAASIASAGPLMGQGINIKTLSVCVQYGCQLTKKQAVKYEYYTYPQTVYTHKVKTLNANLIITTTNANRVVEFAIDAPRYPLDSRDEAIFLKLLQQATGGSYRVDVLSKCFQKLEISGGDGGEPWGPGSAEELMIARENIGVKCYTKPLGNSQSSGIRIFYGQ